MVHFVGHNFRRNHKYGKVPFREILTASLQSPQLLSCAKYRYILNYTLPESLESYEKRRWEWQDFLLTVEVAVCIQGQVEVPCFLAADPSTPILIKLCTVSTRAVICGINPKWSLYSLHNYVSVTRQSPNYSFSYL